MNAEQARSKLGKRPSESVHRIRWIRQRIAERCFVDTFLDYNNSFHDDAYVWDKLRAEGYIIEHHHGSAADWGLGPYTKIIW